MSQKDEPLMEVRGFLVPWSDDPETDYVARWTNKGWASLESAGFLPETRDFMDAYASLLLLDLEEAAEQRPPFAVRRDMRIAQRSASKLRARVDRILRAYDVTGERSDQLVRDRNWLVSIEDDLAADTGIKGRKSREPIYEYFRLVNLAARESGIPFKRSPGPIQLAKHILAAVAYAAERYLMTLERLDEASAKETVAVLRQVRPEGVIREVTKGNGRNRSGNQRNIPVSDSD